MKKQWNSPVITILGVESTEAVGDMDKVAWAECHGAVENKNMCQLNPTGVDVFRKGATFDANTDADYIAWRDEHSTKCAAGNPPSWNPILYWNS